MKAYLGFGVFAAIALLLVIIGLFFRYQYVTSGARTDRVDRLTGAVCTMPCLPGTPMPTGAPEGLQEQRAIAAVQDRSDAQALVLSKAGGGDRYEWAAMQGKGAAVNGKVDDTSTYVVCYCKGDAVGYRWEVHLKSGEIFYMNDNANLSHLYGLSPSSPEPLAADDSNQHSDAAETALITGSWEIREQTPAYGELVWAADASAVPGSSASTIDAVKKSLAGQPATVCERESHLTFQLSGSSQRVPYTEVNCLGYHMTGYVQITRLARDSLSGIFWSEGGVNEGSFQAQKL